jgi:signal transduction histidine kinase
VRNPLGSIGLYARMLEQDLGGLPQQQEMAGKIAAVVQGLDGVVGDVLNFARDVTITPDLLCADDVLSRAVDASVPPGTPVRIVRRGGAEPGSGLGVWCDASLMHQALVNIIRNAVEAMAESPAPSAGHVLVLDAAAAVGHDGRPATVLTVSDTGPGVGREVVDRMFNPFFTTRKAGTGLGLAIVHRIVDAHGGRIVVWNIADRAPEARGATFELVIPSRGAEPRARGTQAMVMPSKEARSVRVQEASR